ncbi:MAG TPA: hypothetical protein VN695_19165, partial [Streptosporangiaceae bacterium]|nr:hypothetical protein [Streptosporangiaceae bacterium]
WFVLAWGTAATIAAAAGPLQARVIPRLTHARAWITTHRDLAFRYLAEETVGSFTGQARAYGLALLATLAAVGYVQAASTLMGPFFVIMQGITLVTVPEAARVLRRSPRHLRTFCLLLAAGLALAAAAWGAVLLAALPSGLGDWLLRGIWRPTYPLILPLTIAVMGACVTAGATAGLRGLGVAKRSLRAELIGSGSYVVFSLAGAAIAGARGSVIGSAAGTLLGAAIWWRQLHVALRDTGHAATGSLLPGRPAGRHRLIMPARDRSALRPAGGAQTDWDRRGET